MQACVGPAAQATWYLRVDVVVGRLKLDPSVFRKVDLDPCVRVLAADDVAVDGGLVCARTESLDKSGRNAKRPEHVPHRRGEELAVALAGMEEEPVHRIGSFRRTLRRERVREQRASQVSLDGR